MRTTLLLLIGLISPTLFALPDLEGVWVLNGPGTESEIRLTAEGRRLQQDYDLLVDDPSLQCIPASTSRVWANPNSRVKITQLTDRIEISYELFDLRRSIPLGDESALTGLPSTRNLNGSYFAEMGTSFARYEGDRLVIESRQHAPGYIRTSRGIPQSANTRTVEMLSREGDVLTITHTYLDDTLFEQPLVLEYFLTRVDESEILPC